MTNQMLTDKKVSSFQQNDKELWIDHIVSLMIDTYLKKLNEM